MAKVHISAEGDKPHQAVKRRVGKTNVGLYCNGCDQFFALAVHERPPPLGIEIISDGQPLFECPYCLRQERRQVSEIAELILTEGLRRRPSRPSGLH